MWTFKVREQEMGNINHQQAISVNGNKHRDILGSHVFQTLSLTPGRVCLLGTQGPRKGEYGEKVAKVMVGEREREEEIDMKYHTGKLILQLIGSKN